MNTHQLLGEIALPRRNTFVFWETIFRCSPYHCPGVYIESLSKPNSQSSDWYVPVENNLRRLLGIGLKDCNVAFANYININDKCIGFALAERYTCEVNTNKEIAELSMISLQMIVCPVNSVLLAAYAFSIFYVNALILCLASPLPFLLPTALIVLTLSYSYIALEYLYLKYFLPSKFFAEYSKKQHTTPSIIKFLNKEGSVYNHGLFSNLAERKEDSDPAPKNPTPCF